jgi:hypothetical protein
MTIKTILKDNLYGTGLLYKHKDMGNYETS